MGAFFRTKRKSDGERTEDAKRAKTDSTEGSDSDED